MNTIDYVYQFDPSSPDAKAPPADAAAARRALEEGNRTFARWMASCRSAVAPGGAAPRHVIPCSAHQVGLGRQAGGVPRQAPFGVVLACSDARVPTEIAFGQGFNDLFVVRVAGNVLGTACAGSVDFAVANLGESVRALVALGHSGCGAVTGAADAYLEPARMRSPAVTAGLRAILEKIFVSVREAAGGLKAVWGAGARRRPGYRAALTESAVCLNAAQAAYEMQRGLAQSGRHDIGVLFGVYNLRTHQVCMPNDPHAPAEGQNARLAPAPADPEAFHALAQEMARRLAPYADLAPEDALPPPLRARRRLNRKGGDTPSAPGEATAKGGAAKRPAAGG
jgi:carbonic anhydrase